MIQTVSVLRVRPIREVLADMATGRRLGGCHDRTTEAALRARLHIPAEALLALTEELGGTVEIRCTDAELGDGQSLTQVGRAHAAATGARFVGCAA